MATTFSMKSGRQTWREDGAGGWVVVSLPPGEVGNHEVIEHSRVGGDMVVAFRGRGGVVYAQPLHDAIDPESVPDATEGLPPATDNSRTE